MADLSTLLTARNQRFSQGFEDMRQGQMFYFTHTDTVGGRCQFCWQALQTGFAVVEVWGSSGSGGRMCCCSAVGVPGNPGAYSKSTVQVCASTYVCGWVGCATEGSGLCYSGRGNCSVACISQAGVQEGQILIAEAGFGGYTQCTTSTPQYCCLAALAFRCANTGAGCGIICNCGGPNSATQAAASGGDINLPGGISCTQFYTCFNCCMSGYEHTLAISPGIHAEGSNCVRYNLNHAPVNYGSCGGNSGRMDQMNALNGFGRKLPQYSACWSNTRDCGCYEFSGCYPNAPGVPGVQGIPCSGVRIQGTRGGHGAVKITLYT